MGIIWIENVGRGKQKETQQEAANLDSFFESRHQPPTPSINQIAPAAK